MTHPMTADTPAAPEKNGKKAIETLERLANTPGSGSDMVLWGEHVNAVLALHAYVAALTAQLEVERATGDETARHISRLLDHLARETARADAAVAEAKALREALDGLATAAERANGEHLAPHDCYATGPATGDPVLDLLVCPGCALKSQISSARATLAPPDAKEKT